MRALALDVSCPPYPEPAHGGDSVNILFHDGSVKTVDNKEDLLLDHEHQLLSSECARPSAGGGGDPESLRQRRRGVRAVRNIQYPMSNAE